MNSVKNAELLTILIEFSNHCIIKSDIKLRLRANKNKNSKCKPYVWTRLKHDTEIKNTFIVIVNK